MTSIFPGIWFGGALGVAYIFASLCLAERRHLRKTLCGGAWLSFGLQPFELSGVEYWTPRWMVFVGELETEVRRDSLGILRRYHRLRRISRSPLA